MFEFDSYQILKALINMLDDLKERIKITALEAIVAYVSIGNKLSAKEIINQISEKQLTQIVNDRLEASTELNPYLNANGALELPYLEQIELTAAN